VRADAVRVRSFHLGIKAEDIRAQLGVTPSNFFSASFTSSWS